MSLPIFQCWILTGEGRSDNYAYLVVDDKSKDAVIIDPANPEEFVSVVEMGDVSSWRRLQSHSSIERADQLWQDQLDSYYEHTSVSKLQMSSHTV